MRVLSATIIALFAFFFKVVRCGDNAHNNPWAKRHNPRFSLSEDNAVNQQNITHLEKRVEGATFTFYDAGLGACGAVNGANDFIVALNAAQYDGGSHCFQTITITVNGKSAQAQITDMCPGCDYGGLDLSRGLFSFLGSESAGKLTGSWNFGGAPTPSPTPTPTPTSTWKPPPTSTSVVKPSSTSSPPPASTTSSSVSTSQAQSTSSIAIPTSTPLIPPLDAGNIADLFLIFLQIGSISINGHAGISPN